MPTLKESPERPPFTLASFVAALTDQIVTRGIVAPRIAAFTAIDRERAFQESKWGTIADHPHDVGGYLTIMRKELREAEDAWCTSHGDENALREILQVIAVGVACLEQHGVVERE